MHEDIKNIERVEAREVKGGFSYHAIMKDGTEVLLRKKATRKYANAFAFEYGGKSNYRNGELAGYFAYGIKPNKYDGPVVKIFPIA